MKKASSKLLLWAAFVLFFLLPAFDFTSHADPVDLSNLTDSQKALLNEHVFGGLPSQEDIYIRNGYVLCYNHLTKTPKWVAYHIKPEYRDTPSRKGKFASFRNDPDIEAEARDADYKGLFTSRGYARGHLAPYAVMGGDRDGDGRLAENDDDDALTIFQSNYMSNIAPQHHHGFNGRPGLWWSLERWIQDDLVKDQGKEVWVFAGCIFGPGDHEKVGEGKDIWVPVMFYKIVVMENNDTGAPTVLAFLFPHQRSAHGSIEDFLTTIDVIEALAGLDFFSMLDDQTENWLEDQDTWEVWKRLFASG
jgi:endonuclease G